MTGLKNSIFGGEEEAAGASLCLLPPLLCVCVVFVISKNVVFAEVIS